MTIKSLTINGFKGVLVFAIMASLSIGANMALAQEHPTGISAKGQAAKMATVTKESLTTAIADYVQKESKLQGGYFMYFDKAQNKPLALTLEDVHKDRFGDMGGGSYFACADFKDKGGDTYDMDIFMKNGKDGMKASDISVHKKNGEARYDWVEKDGIWSKKAK